MDEEIIWKYFRIYKNMENHGNPSGVNSFEFLYLN